jgi:hypothetical protein
MLAAVCCCERGCPGFSPCHSLRPLDVPNIDARATGAQRGSWSLAAYAWDDCLCGAATAYVEKGVLLEL